MMIKIYLFMKKVHRILVLIIITLGLFMGATGTLLKFSAFSAKYFSFFDLGLIRYLHNQISIYFSIVLLLMIFSGTWMYVYIWLKGRKKNQPPQDNAPSKHA
jgi:hypothetical protein